MAFQIFAWRREFHYAAVGFCDSHCSKHNFFFLFVCFHVLYTKFVLEIKLSEVLQEVSICYQ